jgi:hypothetical protein
MEPTAIKTHTDNCVVGGRGRKKNSASRSRASVGLVYNTEV